MVKKLGLLLAFLLAPSLCLAQGGGQFGGSAGGNSSASGIVSGQAANTIPVASGTTALTSAVCTPPATNGVYTVEYSVTASAAVAPTCPESGLTSRAVSGTTDTILYSDNGFKVQYTGSAATAVTLPTPTTLTNANFVTQLENRGTATVTVTPTTNMISLNGAVASTSAAVLPGQQCALTVDGTTSTQWDLNCYGLGSNGGANVLATNYGVKADEIRRFDATLTGIPAATGNSTSPAAPATTTTQANDIVLAIFELTASNYSAGPGGTSLISGTQSAGFYGTTVTYQTVASPGSVSAVGATFASGHLWSTATIALEPISGQTITFRAETACASSGSTCVQQSSGNNIVLNVPAATANNDFMIACIESYANNFENTNAILAPPQWNYRLVGTLDTALTNSVGGNRLNCYGKYASSEPSNYTFTEPISTLGLTGFIIAAHNVNLTIPVDNLPTITSAGASFTSADVGKDICVAAVLQSCGTITSVTSGTVITCQTCWAGSGTNREYRYGTDGTTQLQAAINAVGTAGGGQLDLTQGGIMVTSQLTLPASASIHIKGVSAETANWGYQGNGTFSQGLVVNNKNIGSEIDFATTGINGPAILLNGGNNGIVNNVQRYVLEDFSVWGGAGNSQDGAGSHCFEMINASWVTLRNVVMGNCAGNGLLVTNATTTGYTDGITLDASWFMLNGLAGGYFLNPGPNLIQNVVIHNSQFDNNSRYGLELGGLIYGIMIDTSNFQRNGSNLASTYSNLFFDNGGGTFGCSMQGNYFETDATGGIANMYNIATTNNVYCSWSYQSLFGVTDSNLPTISSGFGTSPSIVTANDTVPSLDFEVNVGTGGSATSGVIGLPPTPNAWMCQAQDMSTAIVTRMSAETKTTATFTAASAWVASDKLAIHCGGM